MPGFGGFPELPRASPRRRALLGFFPFGKSRLLRNTYKCKPFLRIAYDLLGLHKIKRLHLCIFTARSQARYLRINSIFNVVLSVWPLFCVLRAFDALPLCLYGLLYLSLYGVLRAYTQALVSGLVFPCPGSLIGLVLCLTLFINFP